MLTTTQWAGAQSLLESSQSGLCKLHMRLAYTTNVVYWPAQVPINPAGIISDS